MNLMRNRKFKNYFINPSFQWEFVRGMLMLSFVIVAIVYGANYYFFYLFAQKGSALGLAPNHVFFGFLASQKTTMNGIFVITAFIVVVLVVIRGIVFSHRIAGPLYRLNQDLIEMSRTGRLRRIKFRNGDYFLELPESFNAVVAHPEQRRSEGTPGAD